MSIFDRYYIKELFGGVVYPDGTCVIDCVDEIIEHQKIFMQVVSDTRKANMFTFPVLTYSLLKKKVSSPENIKKISIKPGFNPNEWMTEADIAKMRKTKEYHVFVDEEFARWCSDHNTVWNDSNFFMSTDCGVLSNCCFDGSTKIKWIDEDNIVHSDKIGPLYDAGKRDVLTTARDGSYKKARIIRLDTRPMLCIRNDEYDIDLGVTDNHIFPTNNGDKFARDLIPGTDKLLYASRTEDGNIEEIEIDFSTERIVYNWPYVYCLEMEDQDDPYFVLDNNLITHNCRLLSDTKKLNAFINSIGGTALSIGSIKVNTINLMRIVYEADQWTTEHWDENTCNGDCNEMRKKVYLNILRNRVLLCCKLLDVQRHIITRNIQKGLLPNFCDGGIEMDKCYSTVGILGMYEVIEALGMTKVDEFGNRYYTQAGIDFASEIFEVINDVKDSFNTDKHYWIKVDTNIPQYEDLRINYSFNCESVPAERAAVILCQKDNALYQDSDICNDDRFIYSNQWIPLSEQCTLKEKLRVCSILDQKCSGGSIAHINLESNFPNTEAAWINLNEIALSDVIYFAYNTRINECKNHHAFLGNVCDVCGEGVFDTYQRIVGYLVPTRSYSKDRKKEFNSRLWFEYAQTLME